MAPENGRHKTCFWPFTSNSNRKGRDGAPLTVRSIERLLKSIVNDELHIPVHASTHMLRKTFAYHFLMAAPDRNRALELLSMQLNHSSIAYTLRYIGITQDEILEACLRINLGFSPLCVEASIADNTIPFKKPFSESKRC